MGRRRCLISALGLQQSVLWLFGLPGLPGLAEGAELSLIIQPGIEQRRSYDRDDFWTQQWVRRLPPDNSEHLLTVQGPDEWRAGGRQPPRGPDIGRLNAEHAEIFRTAMVEQDLLTTDQPLLLAGRIIALLRPLEIDSATAPARRVRIWPLWEVLAYSPHADTLSVAVAVVQTLETVDIGARIARYPAADGQYRFGVLMPAPAGEISAGPWAHRAGGDFLLPVALSAKPAADLQPDDLLAWSWQEVLAPSWGAKSPKPGAPPGEPPAADPSQQEREALPDLCRQAEALNLECVSGDPREGRETTLLTLSALTLVALAGWLASLLCRRRLRLLRVGSERDVKRRNQF